ncbi:MAG: PorT family protein [Taibaiella sp.]|nr:PorT family protein [Taibaiella sp.]
MDKNFIKIDDLVRQRLGGMEERERSGSWLNMRELLDKEMPQRKRIGIFYWRRIFNAVAIMSLVATVCVGSYEFSSAFRGNNNSNVTAVADVSGVNREAGNSFNLPANENTSVESEKEVTKLAGRYNTGKEQKKRYIAPANRTDKLYATTSTSSVAGKESVAKHQAENVDITSKATNSNATATTTSTYISVNNHKSSVTKSKGLINESGSRNAAGVAAENGMSGIANNSANESTANTAVTAVTAIPSSSRKEASTQLNEGSSNTNVAIAANRTNKTKLSSKNRQSAGVALNDNNQLSVKNIKENTATDNNAIAANAKRANSNKTKSMHSRVADSRNSVNGASDMAEMALNSSNKSNGADKTAVEKMAIATQTPMSVKSDNPTAASATPIPEIQAGISASESKNGATSAHTATQASAVAANNPVARSLGTGGVASKNPAVEKTSQNKKVIMKLLVHQRKIKISDNEYSDQLDTISMEKVHKDLGIKTANSNTTSDDNLKNKKGNTELASTANTAKSNAAITAAAANENSNKTAGGNATAANTTTADNAPAVKEKAALSTSGAVAAKSAKAGRNKKAANNSAAANDEASGAEIEGSAANENNTVAAQPVIGAATTAATLPAGSTEVKNKPEVAKKNNGVSLVQKLSLAFNDVKQNAAGAKFTAGLTAGINSNYFGTASFKGFQFGVTGNLIFNDTWNLMTEVKYFHRLNNNTSVDDNYYTYTQVGTQYRRDLQLNSYSFSALHSLEMPVAIRYSRGNFNFYTGGNFLYTFSINTGAETMPAVNSTATFVNQPGTDNAPTLSEQDFRSRFGLGYLLGFAYQVAPSVSMDLRSVQTVWDNAATTGAKSISGQLYKTPSIQLSVMYRLGGNRNKD